MALPCRSTPSVRRTGRAFTPWAPCTDTCPRSRLGDHGLLTWLDGRDQPWTSQDDPVTWTGEAGSCDNTFTNTASVWSHLGVQQTSLVGRERLAKDSVTVGFAWTTGCPRTTTAAGDFTRTWPWSMTKSTTETHPGSAEHDVNRTVHVDDSMSGDLGSVTLGSMTADDGAKDISYAVTLTPPAAGEGGQATATNDPMGGGDLGTADWNAAGTPASFGYTAQLDAPAEGCEDVPNTATIVETGQTADHTVEMCVVIVEPPVVVPPVVEPPVVQPPVVHPPVAAPQVTPPQMLPSTGAPSRAGDWLGWGVASVVVGV